ncbi:MAG: TolC family protein [Cyanobacteriota bacterium]
MITDAIRRFTALALVALIQALSTALAIPTPSAPVKAASVRASVAASPELSVREPRPDPGLERLERRWRDLDRQLAELDRLLPEDAAAPAAPERALSDPSARSAPPVAAILPPSPLSLPAAIDLASRRPLALSLEQALGIGFAASPGLQSQRDLVAAAVDELRALLASRWPTLSLFADAGSSQAYQVLTAPIGNGALGFGPQFSPSGLLTPGPPSQPTAGAFYVPDGGAASLVTTTNSYEAGLRLDLALIAPAREARIQQARARLREARQHYSSQLRALQLEISEGYYQLQQADQLVLIRQAALRNDLLILQDTLDLKAAGLRPRLDVLRRRAIEAGDQEALIQAIADQKVASLQFAALLNLPPALVPRASDPVRMQPRWPLNLEATLLAAYQGNPELEAILATRDALARQRDAVVAALLPRLSLFASGGFSGSTTANDHITAWGGGCCGSTVIPATTSGSSDWSVGLAVRWLLFDGGSLRAQASSIRRRDAATAQEFAVQRNRIRVRLEKAFLQHEASLARLASARRGVAAALEAFRDVRLRYASGLSSELDLSSTQDRLITSLVRRLTATVSVNLTYAQLLRELLPMPTDPTSTLTPILQWPAGS